MNTLTLNKILLAIGTGIWLVATLVHFTQIADAIIAAIGSIIAFIIFLFPNAKGFQSSKQFQSPLTTVLLSVTCTIGIAFIVIPPVISSNNSNTAISENITATNSDTATASSTFTSTPPSPSAELTYTPTSTNTSTPAPPTETFTPQPPTPTITPIPSSIVTTPTSLYQNFMFRDDFDGRLRDEWQTINAEYTIQGGELLGTGGLSYEVKHKNVVIRARGKGKYIGLFFREQLNSDGYYIGFVGEDERFIDNVIILYEVTSGKQNIRQINLPPSVNMNDYNEFEIVIENKNAIIRINNEEVATFVIGKYLEGDKVGVSLFPETTIDYFEASFIP